MLAEGVGQWSAYIFEFSLLFNSMCYMSGYLKLVGELVLRFIENVGGYSDLKAGNWQLKTSICSCAIIGLFFCFFRVKFLSFFFQIQLSNFHFV